MGQEDKTSRRECDESGSRGTETGAQREAQVRLPVRGYCPFTQFCSRSQRIRASVLWKALMLRMDFLPQSVSLSVLFFENL